MQNDDALTAIAGDEASRAAMLASAEFRYNPLQPRDADGRWADTGLDSSLGGGAEPDGGFTVDVGGRKPIESGYAVALSGSDRLLLAADAYGADGKPTPAFRSLVKDRISAVMGVKAPAGTQRALGAWHNPDDGKLEVNTSVVFPNTPEGKSAAMKFAADQDQIAIFDLSNFETIPTGGTGGDRTVVASGPLEMSTVMAVESALQFSTESEDLPV